MAPTFLPLRSSYFATFIGFPFGTTTTGPYHQAGPEKLMTFTRSGLTWMSAAITSIRFDSNEGITDSQGIQTTLTFVMPNVSSTALLISQSMPAGCLLASWKNSGGFSLEPRLMPFLTALSKEGSLQLAKSGLYSACCASAGAESAPARASANTK